MSEWIRTGSGHPWHRVNALDYRDGFQRGELRMTCGATLPIQEGLEERVPDRIGVDDQHPSCRTRAMREAYWQAKWTGGFLPDVVRGIVTEAAPWLVDLEVLGPDEIAGVGNVFRVTAANLDAPISGAGRRWSDAAADLAATLESHQP